MPLTKAARLQYKQNACFIKTMQELKVKTIGVRAETKRKLDEMRSRIQICAGFRPTFDQLLSRIIQELPQEFVESFDDKSENE